MHDPSIFSYDGIAAVLRRAREVAPVLRLRDWEGGNGLILRHDVDLSLEAAHALALVEERCGVRSTFFILVTCPYYNPLAEQSRRLLADLVERGFEIGLHFDAALHPEADDASLARHARREADVLELASGAPVESLSLHNPSVTGRYPLLDGFRNAYDPRIFGDGRYLSDSRMRFMSGNIHDFVERAADEVVQLLLHPMHYSEHGGGYPELMRAHAVRLIESIDAGWRVNSEYAESVAGSLLELVREHRAGSAGQ